MKSDDFYKKFNSFKLKFDKFLYFQATRPGCKAVLEVDELATLDALADGQR